MASTPARRLWTRSLIASAMLHGAFEGTSVVRPAAERVSAVPDDGELPQARFMRRLTGILASNIKAPHFRSASAAREPWLPGGILSLRRNCGRAFQAGQPADWPIGRNARRGGLLEDPVSRPPRPHRPSLLAPGEPSAKPQTKTPELSLRGFRRSTDREAIRSNG
jgi:hypothetical protein